jgi:glutathione S-transferase
VVIGSNVRWGTSFKLIPDRPEFTAYSARIAARPAAKRAQDKDEALAKA